jgi:hypothetical protein
MRNSASSLEPGEGAIGNSSGDSATVVPKSARTIHAGHVSATESFRLERFRRRNIDFDRCDLANALLLAARFSRMKLRR